MWTISNQIISCRARHFGTLVYILLIAIHVCIVDGNLSIFDVVFRSFSLFISKSWLAFFNPSLRQESFATCVLACGSGALALPSFHQQDCISRASRANRVLLFCCHRRSIFCWWSQASRKYKFVHQESVKLKPCFGLAA